MRHLGAVQNSPLAALCARHIQNIGLTRSISTAVACPAALLVEPPAPAPPAPSALCYFMHEATAIKAAAVKGGLLSPAGAVGHTGGHHPGGACLAAAPLPARPGAAEPCTEAAVAQEQQAQQPEQASQGALGTATTAACHACEEIRQAVAATQPPRSLHRPLLERLKRGLALAQQAASTTPVGSGGQAPSDPQAAVAGAAPAATVAVAPAPAAAAPCSAGGQAGRERQPLTEQPQRQPSEQQVACRQSLQQHLSAQPHKTAPAQQAPAPAQERAEQQAQQAQQPAKPLRIPRLQRRATVQPELRGHLGGIAPAAKAAAAPIVQQKRHQERQPARPYDAPADADRRQGQASAKTAAPRPAALLAGEPAAMRQAAPAAGGGRQGSVSLEQPPRCAQLAAPQGAAKHSPSHPDPDPQLAELAAAAQEVAAKVEAVRSAAALQAAATVQAAVGQHASGVAVQPAGQLNRSPATLVANLVARVHQIQHAAKQAQQQELPKEQVGPTARAAALAAEAQALVPQASSQQQHDQEPFSVRPPWTGGTGAAEAACHAHEPAGARPAAAAGPAAGPQPAGLGASTAPAVRPSGAQAQSPALPAPPLLKPTHSDPPRAAPQGSSSPPLPPPPPPLPPPAHTHPQQPHQLQQQPWEAPLHA